MPSFSCIDFQKQISLELWGALHRRLPRHKWWNLETTKLIHTYTKAHLEFLPFTEMLVTHWDCTQQPYATHQSTVLLHTYERQMKQTYYPLRRGRARWWNKQRANNTKRERRKTNSVEGDEWEMKAANWLAAGARVRAQEGRRNTEDKYKRDRKWRTKRTMRKNRNELLLHYCSSSTF